MKLLCDMTEPELGEYFTRLARLIESELPPGPSKNGTCMFTLLVWDTLEGGVGQYVANAARPGMIKMLREVADRLERRQDVTR